jgi:ribose-phosphate pyrophosphokinase
MAGRKTIKLFYGNSNPELAKEISENIGIPVGRAGVGKFSDGEIAINIEESVRGADVFVIQSVCPPVNDNLMELLILMDAMKRASAGRITAVIPYYGYARQDRKTKARDPITAKLVADLISVAGADRILTMDLHAAQIQGYFNIPVDHLLGAPILAEYFMKKQMRDAVVVSPDVGSVARARYFANMMNLPIAIVDKRRPKANVAEVVNVIGDIKNKDVVLIDDIIDTGGSITGAANAMRELGAGKIFACCTHAVFSGPAIERIEGSLIEEMVILDTIPLMNDKTSKKITTLSVAPIFAEAITRIYEDLSVSKLFDQS